MASSCFAADFAAIATAFAGRDSYARCQAAEHLLTIVTSDELLERSDRS